MAEKFGPSLKTLSSLGFEKRNLGCPGNFAGMSRIPGGVQKVRAHFSFPKLGWARTGRAQGCDRAREGCLCV